MKEWIKKRLIIKLKITGFVLSLVGWFMLVTISAEFVGYKLGSLEGFVTSPTFTWGLRIFVIALLVLMLKGQKLLEEILQKHNWLRTVLKVIVWGGVVGWVVGIVSSY